MADTHAKHHDYHLVNPSPWPVIGADLRPSSWRSARSSGCARWAAAAGLFGIAGPRVFAVGFAGVLLTMFMWWRDVISEAHGGDHTPVVQLHLRYGMILFIASEVMFFVAWFWAYFDAALFPAAHPSRSTSSRPTAPSSATKEIIGMVERNALTGGHWPPKPSDGLPRHLRSLGPAAGQHADPADLGHDGDLGAPRAAREQPQGPGLGPGADRHPRRHVHRLPGLRVHARGLQLRRPHLRLDVLHGDGLPRRARHHRHDLPDRLPVPRDGAATSRRSSTSASRRLPGTGTSSTWSGCSCSPASTCGVPARRWRTDGPARRIGERSAAGDSRTSSPGGIAARAALGGNAGAVDHGRMRARVPDQRPRRRLRRAAARAAARASCSRRAELRDKCERCGLDYRFIDTGDGPAVFAIFILGFLVLGGALWWSSPRAAGLGACRAVGRADAADGAPPAAFPQGDADRPAVQAQGRAKDASSE